MLERTLPTVWVLRGRDIPSLAGTSRDQVIVVACVETLCAAIVVEQSRSGAPYAARELADLYESLAYLLGRTIEVLPSYDRTVGRQIHDPWTAGFKAWLHVELSRDLIDQWRSWFGRHGQKRSSEPQLPSEEEGSRSHVQFDPIDPSDPIEYGADHRTDRLVAAVEGFAPDGPDDWFDGRLWNEHRRNRKSVRKVEAVGFGTPRRAQDGDRIAIDEGKRAACRR